MKKSILFIVFIVSCIFCFGQTADKYIKELTKKAKKGDVESMRYLGLRYQLGLDVEQNFTKAFEWYGKAAEKGDALAMSNLGMLYLYDDFRSEEKAFEWYAKAADKNEVWSMYMVGSFYYQGKGCTQDYNESFKWWEKAAEKGNEKAMNNLGDLYHDGKGVRQDYAKAFEWYEKSAKKGNKDAINNMGMMYYKGEGVEQDYKKAYELFTTVEDDIGFSKGFLSEMYYNGYYVKKDYNRAFVMAKEGAEHETHPSGTAMRILSACYRYGLGGASIDKEKSEYWLKESANHNDEKAISALGL